MAGNTHVHQDMNAGASKTSSGLGLIAPGVTQTGVLVALIITASQPFGSEWFKSLLKNIFGMQDVLQYSMVIAALIISLFVAIWQVRYVQKLCGGMCLLSTVLAWLVLFSMAIGGNNSLKDAVGENVATNQTSMSQAEVTALVEDNKRVRKELDDTLRFVSEFRKTLLRETSDAAGTWFSFVSEAYAQEAAATEAETQGTSLSAEQLQELDEKLREIESQLTKLKSEEPVIEKSHPVVTIDEQENVNKVMH